MMRVNEPLDNVQILRDLDVTGVITGDGSSLTNLPDPSNMVTTDTTQTITGSKTWNDDVKAIFGTSGDGIELYHSSDNSYIDDVGSGGLRIRVAGTANNGFYKYASNEPLATFEPDGPVTLYYDNSPKLATVTGGVDVTGTLTADTLTSGGNVTSGNDVYIPNGRILRWIPAASSSIGKILFGNTAGTGGELSFIRSSDSAEAFNLTAAGAATFSSSVTATSFQSGDRLIISGNAIRDPSGTGNNKGFSIGGAGLVPVNGAGTGTDNLVDVGTSSLRFKDVYLSGQIQVGGSQVISSSRAATFVGINSTSGTVQFTDGGNVFDSSDASASGYPAFAVSGGSAQIGFRRTGNSTGVGYIGADVNNVLAAFDSGFVKRFIVTQGGTVIVPTGSVRGTTWYDVSDTTFFADLAGTTDSINMDGSLKMNADGAKIKLNDPGTNSGGGLYWSAAGSSDSYSIYRETGAWSNPYPDLMIQFHTGIQYHARSDYDGHRFFTGNTGDGDTLAMTIGNSGSNTYVIAHTDMRSPVFYDYDNTNYYADLASASTSINVAGDIKMDVAGSILHFTDAGSASGNGIYWNTLGTSESYAIFRDPGAWTNPYPDLMIQFHTGIQYHARSDYEGHRWYTGNTGDGDDLAMQLGDSGDNQSLLVMNDVKAPVFYDKNDTNFYLNAASSPSLVVNGDIILPTVSSTAGRLRGHVGGLEVRSNRTSDMGILGTMNNGNTFGFQLYAAYGTLYGFLNANWGGWDLSLIHI